MTKEEVIELGVKAQTARDVFAMLGMMNTRTDPAERAVQIRTYETARADLQEAENRHYLAMAQLGVS